MYLNLSSVLTDLFDDILLMLVYMYTVNCFSQPEYFIISISPVMILF